MKGKCITSQMIMACYSKPPANEKNIYEQLEETIAERKKIMQQYELMLAGKNAPAKKPIHTELEETIAVLRKTIQRYGQLFTKQQAAGGELLQIEQGKLAA